MMPSVQPGSDHHSMVWLLLSTRVTRSLRSFWQHFDGICSSAVLVSLLRDWTSCMTYLWNCLNCSKKICQTEQAGQEAGISKKHTVFFTRYATFCCLVGQRTLVALSTAT